MRSELKKKIEYTRQIAYAAALIKKREDHLRRTTRDFAEELQCALRLMVGFWNISYELQQICRFYVTNLSVKLSIKVKINRNLFFYIVIHKAFVFADPNNCISVTIKN